jgi:methylmalonyl-CoA mutase
MSSSPGYKLRNHVRFITATSLFDGHDASINIIRRLLQQSGVEVVHLGHNRSVAEIVDSAVQEDVQGIAVSSYQGGHIEFFRYMVDMLAKREASHIKIFGGGGGVIVPAEIRTLEENGVTKIYSPEDGRRLGLRGIIDDILEKSDFALQPLTSNGDLSWLSARSVGPLARLITQVELKGAGPDTQSALEHRASERKVPVIGMTGTGGSGKSSLADELVHRLVSEFEDLHVGIVSIDPTKRKTGGALFTCEAWALETPSPNCPRRPDRSFRS